MTQVVRVHFVLPSGEVMTYDGAVGDSLLDVALDNNVPGIIGQCGGGCTCCTCHVWVDEPPLEAFPPAHRDELDMLEYAWGRNESSRLSCQVRIEPDLQSITVSVPERQA